MSAPTTRSKAKTLGLAQTTSPVASEHTTSTKTSVMQSGDAIHRGELELRSEGTVVNRRTTGSNISKSSSNKRAQLLAQIELQEKEKEDTEAAVALARSKLQLIQLNDDNSTEDDDLGDVDKGDMVSDWVDKSTERKGKENKNDNVTNLAAAIVDAINSTKSNVPKVPPKYINELQYFDGDPREWISFRANFKDTATYFSNIENVARLRKAIKGQARDSVKSLMYTTQNPDDILQALERRFGRPTFLIKSEIAALEKIPPMGSEITGIGSFASAVANSVNTIKMMNKVEYLYSYDISEKIIQKMNVIVRFRWHEYRAAHEEEPILLSLSKFLNTIADQFEIYEGAPKPRVRRDFHRVPLRNKVNAATHASDSEPSENSESESDLEYEEERKIVFAAMYPTKCLLCKKNHELQKCDLFEGQKVMERWATVKALNACFKCLRTNHRSINCKAKTCTIDGCIGRHHPLLHNSEPAQRQDSRKETETVSVNHVNNKRAYLKILPVDLTGPKGTVTVGALLDEGSTVTLLLDEVAQQIGATGPKREITIEGVTGHLMRAEKSEKVDICIRGKQTHNIENMSAHTIQELNLTPQQINYEDIQDCPHLMSVSDCITYEKIQPSILIGQDNWHLIVTRELKTGGVNKPVASLTKLGWILHGYRTSTVKPVMFTGHLNYKLEDSDSEWDEYEKERKLVFAAMNITKCPLCNKWHELQKCTLFERQTIKERWETVKSLTACFKCLKTDHRVMDCKAETCTIDGCVKRHHLLLHSEPAQRENKEPKIVSMNTKHDINNKQNKRAYLEILPVDLTGPESTVTVGALLDEKSTETILVDEIAQQSRTTALSNEVIMDDVTGHIMQVNESQKVDLPIEGKQTPNCENVSVHIIFEELNLTPQHVSSKDIDDRPQHKNLHNGIDEKLQLLPLLDQDNWDNKILVKQELKTGTINKPVASLTKMEWLLHGHGTSTVKPALTGHKSHNEHECSETKIKDLLRSEPIIIIPKQPAIYLQLATVIWKTPERSKLSLKLVAMTSTPPQCVDPITPNSLQFTASSNHLSTRRLPEGRFGCGLLWKTDGETMHPNRESTLKRFIAVERKMNKDRAFKTKYTKQIKNLFETVQNTDDDVSLCNNNGQNKNRPNLNPHAVTTCYTLPFASTKRFFTKSEEQHTITIPRESFEEQTKTLNPNKTMPRPLPTERLRKGQHFYSRGDYFGPMQVTVNRQEKQWAHPGIALSLKTDGATLTIRSIMARTKKPEVHSNSNGTELVITDKEMSKATENRQKAWKSIPAQASHMGGAWQPIVPTVQTALTSELQSRRQGEEMLHSLLFKNSNYLAHSRPPDIVPRENNDAESWTQNLLWSVYKVLMTWYSIF